MERIDFKKIAFATVLLIAISAMSVGVVLWSMRDEALTDLEREVDTMATILAEQVERSSQAIEIILDELVARAQDHTGDTDADYRNGIQTRQIFDEMSDKLKRLPQADVITFTDSAGRVLNITRGWPTPKVDLSDRDYFKHLSSTSDHSLFVSVPVQNKVTREWTVYFAKRIENRAGRFMGVALVGFRPEYFLRTIDVVSSIPGRSLLLLRKDGIVMLRHPDPTSRTGYSLPAGSEWYAIAQKGGRYRSPGVFDGEARRIAVRPTQSYPLVVNVGGLEDMALAEWRSRAWPIGIIAALIEGLLAAAVSTLYLQLRKLHESQRTLAEKSRETSLANARFDATLASMSHGLAMFDRHGELLIHNTNFPALLGLDPDDPAAWRSLDVLLEFFERRCLASSGSGSALPAVVTPDGVANARASEILDFSDGRSCRVIVDPMPSGGWVMTCEDITATRAANSRIEWLAHYDALTGLANRANFVDRLRSASATPNGKVPAVLLIDLDHFKEVNDTFGHGVGDLLLCGVARRLRETAADADLVARLGGDEFAVLMMSAGNELEPLSRLMEAIQVEVSRPYRIGGTEVTVGASIGLTRCEGPTDGAEVLLRQADLALYRAKSEGRGRCRVFEISMQEEHDLRQTLIGDLRSAADRGELSLHFQPIVNAQSSEIVSMEALLRWTHPARGSISPAVFIPLAEEAGLICDLGVWVLVEACREAATWSPSIKLAVNVSPIQIGKANFPAFVSRVLAETGLDPRRLQLEVTESVLLSEVDRAAAVLCALRDLGTEIVLDDFGTGYSSLSYLKRFPFNEIKIDKSFVDDLSHRGCAALVAATITLAREFDMIVTAEGVETELQMELLRAMSVQQIQGYFTGRPNTASFWRGRTTPEIASRRA